MSSQKEREIALKLVEISTRLQPRVSVVGNALQFVHQGRTVKISLFGGTTVRSNNVLSK